MFKWLFWRTPSTLKIAKSSPPLVKEAGQAVPKSTRPLAQLILQSTRSGPTCIGEVTFIVEVHQSTAVHTELPGLSHPFFGNGAEAHGIGKTSGVLTKIGKLDIVLMYDVYIARLIPIIKLTLVYYEKRERKKQVFLYSMK